MPISTKEFIAALVDSGLLTAEEIRDAQQSLSPAERETDLMSLARELVKRRKLTKYQAGRIYQGKPAGLVLGNYVVLEKIGEGGMGEVFKAEHRRMKRVVAIKTLPITMTESSTALKRFQREVEAAARLVHPNIVTAFDADEYNGTHYLVMEYVDGQNLSNIVKKQGPLSVETAVSCMIQAARGLAFAHSQGIIHRDMKPHNLLLDKSGAVKILDMGLVRFDSATDSDGIVRTKLTYQDQIVGTVDYMSPEQADDTSGVDHRTDIYSLGCTLYRVLTGRPLYDGESTIQKLMAHREFAVPPLQAVRSDVPIELERVYQKMVAKNREDRFGSMDELIAALEGRPAIDIGQGEGAVSARDSYSATRVPSGGTAVAPAPPAPLAKKSQNDKGVTIKSQGEKDTKREGKKKPVAPQPPPRPMRSAGPSWIVVSAAVAGLVALVFLGFILWKSTNRPPRLVIVWPLSERQDPKLKIDDEPQEIVPKERLEFVLKPGHYQIHVGRRGFQPIDSDVNLRAGKFVEFKPVWSPNVEITPTIPSTPIQDPRVLRSSWLTTYQQRAEKRVAAAKQLRDRWERLAGSQTPLDGLQRDSIPKYELKQAGAGNPAAAPSELVAVLGDSRLRHASFVHQVAFDPENEILAAAGHNGEITLWNTVRGEQVRVLKGHGSEVRCVAFSPAGKLLASGGLDTTVRFWDTSDGKPKDVPLETNAKVLALAFGRKNSRVLATAGDDKKVRLWNIVNRQEFGAINHDDKVLSVALSDDRDDGLLGASCSEDGAVKVWNAKTQQESPKLAGHSRAARAVAFVPDTHLVVSGGDDAEIVLWNGDTGEEVRRFDWWGVQVRCLAVSPDGKTLASGSGQGRIRLWDLETKAVLFDYDRPAFGVAFSPDGLWLAYCGGPPQAVGLFHVDKRADHIVRVGHSSEITGLSFDSQGEKLASSGNDHTVRLWDLREARQDKKLLGHTNSVTGVAFREGGDLLISGGADLTLREWNAASGQETRSITRPGDLSERVMALALSPDGNTLACASADRAIRLWDLQTGLMRRTITGHTDVPLTIAFSPDGAVLATGGEGGTIRLFDVATGQPALVLSGHEGPVVCLAFNPDGSLLASGGKDSQLKLWNLITLGPPEPLTGHISGIRSVDFSPDGQTLISAGSAPGDLKLWDMAQKKLLGTIATATSPLKVLFSPEGRHFATANSDGTIYIFRVGPR